MNLSNIQIDEESVDGNERTYYLSRINPKMPWPANGNLAAFASQGRKYKKYKILTDGSINVKIIVTKE